MKRITTIVGAGAVLDLDLPAGIMHPSTKNITDSVRELREKNVLSGKDIIEIEEIYQILKDEYPCYPNFEHIFHVLEMSIAYGWVWQHPTSLPKTTTMYPVFAPFTSPKWLFDFDNVKQALDHVILSIMDIVDGYNAPYLDGICPNQWYRDFWRGYPGEWDIFNLNYDTTIEHTLDHCEDGFDDIPGQPEFQHFVPQKLWENPNGYSTMSHLHGCIEFFDSRYSPEIYEKEYVKYGFHDLYKYPSYKKVRGMFIGTGKSKPSNQAGEQYVNAPIITGLMKPDKLSILPFAYYHSHLYNCVMRNNSLLIVGYSFGDLYINQILERMELVYGNAKRVVLIDYWQLLVDNETIDSIPDNKERSACVRNMMVKEIIGNKISNDLAVFLCRMTGKSAARFAVESFANYDNVGPMVSENGCLMLFIGGFKAASAYRREIYEFLNS